MPKVSIILPTYNRERFVGEAIESVLAQNFTDFELIVVDDGSTDQTASRVTQIGDPRLIYVFQKNKGRSNARNRALSIARGDYIAFLDSDDAYLPGKLALQIAYMDDHPSVGMIYTSARCIDEDGNEVDARYIASVSGRIYTQIAFFKPVTITLPTVMVRTDLFAHVGGFDERMHRFEDTDMWRRLSKVTDIHALPTETCRLRTHRENHLKSQDPNEIASAIEYYAAKIRREDTDIPQREIRKGLASLYVYYGYAFLSVPSYATVGGRLLWRAVELWPPIVFDKRIRQRINRKIRDSARFLLGHSRHSRGGQELARGAPQHETNSNEPSPPL